VAIVIAPGGRFSSNIFGPEGEQPAAYFNKLGITAFVLKYRLSREPGSKVTVEVSAKEDGYRAMRMVRAKAADYGVDPAKIGFIGFSAGGEVVSSVVFRHTLASQADQQNDSRKLSLLPSFSIRLS